MINGTETPHRASRRPTGAWRGARATARGAGRRLALAAAVVAATLLLGGRGAAQLRLADGLYAQIHTAKGAITARLEPDLTPLAVANFVGLAEGTIENAAFDRGRPFFDGTAYHRVVPGHVVQAGAPASDRADGPGYVFPNEIHARLGHGRAGMLNMANGGPHTNASQFSITLGDRSYLDGDYIVFGEVVDGMDVVTRIVQGDVIDSVRIRRVGQRAQVYRVDTESFRALVRAAEERVADLEQRKRAAEREWIARNYPHATGPAGGVLTAERVLGSSNRGGGPLRVRYRGTRVRYMGHLLGYTGPELETVAFGSGEDGVPGFVGTPRVFTYRPGETRINPGLDAALAEMTPGEHRTLIVPPELGYGRAGLYPPETPGEPRFVVSPNTLLVYEIEVLAPDRAGTGAGDGS